MKLFKSKKTLAVLAVVLVLAIAGGTYAWFVLSARSPAAGVDMGRLDMAATFSIPQSGNVFEPGETVDVSTTIKNTGSLNLLARVEVDATSYLVRNESGTLYGDGYRREIQNDGNVVPVLDEDQLGYGMVPGVGVFAWFYNPDVEGEYYVSLQPDVEFSVDYEVLLKGREMTNEYMDAEIVFSTSWLATQNEPGAVADELGVDLSRLVAIQNQITLAGPFASPASSQAGSLTFDEVYEILFGVPYNN